MRAPQRKDLPVPGISPGPSSPRLAETPLMKRRITLLAAPLAIALILAGCGSNSAPSSSAADGYGSAAPASSGHRAAAATKLGIGNSPLGRIVVDSKGSTLSAIG